MQSNKIDIITKDNGNLDASTLMLNDLDEHECQDLNDKHVPRVTIKKGNARDQITDPVIEIP